MAGKAVAFAEMLEFGKQYAKQVVANAKALGQALHERGFALLGEHKGFTESHQIAVDVSKFALGGDMERALESANIIVKPPITPRRHTGWKALPKPRRHTHRNLGNHPPRDEGKRDG